MLITAIFINAQAGNNPLAFNWYMAQTFWTSYDSITRRNKQEQITDRCNDMEVPQMYCAERNKPDSKGYILHDSIYITSEKKCRERLPRIRAGGRV